MVWKKICFLWSWFVSFNFYNKCSVWNFFVCFVCSLCSCCCFLMMSKRIIRTRRKRHEFLLLFITLQRVKQQCTCKSIRSINKSNTDWHFSKLKSNIWLFTNKPTQSKVADSFFKHSSDSICKHKPKHNRLTNNN